MTADRPRSVTRLLQQARAGDHEAFNRLVPLVYDELRAMAARLLRAERRGHTLRPTALVHEAYIRLVDQRTGWRDRAHFFAVGARIMRRILVDHARARGSTKRGGSAPRVPLDDTVDPAGHDVSLDEVLEIDEALGDLEAFDPLEARIVELRYFGGLTIEEASDALDVSPATVKREWTVARAWLHHRLTGGSLGAR